MTRSRKKWSGDGVHPQAPDLVLSILVKWQPDSTGKYSTINGYEPDNFTAAAAWTKIPKDLIASDAFIYKDKTTGLWVQAVGYPLIPVERVNDWIDLQISHGAVCTWTNLCGLPRRLQKPYTLKEVPAKVIDKVTYIEMLAHQNKFIVNGQNLCDLNPVGRPKDIDVFAESPERKQYQKRNTGIFHIRRNSRFIETPKGVYASISSAASDMEMSFSGITFHLKKNSKGYRYITADEYLLRINKLNTDNTTE